MLAMLLPCLLSPIPTQDPEPLTAAEFARIHAEIVPTEEQKWQTIPWATDIAAARTRAISEGKPLFLWSMNGHPMGCT
jgi:hypothetical protein